MVSCNSCFSPNAKACVCRTVAYCNATCQRKDWTNHRVLCSQVIVKENSFVANQNICEGQTVLALVPLITYDR